jgi:hypothetical protein
MVDFEKLTTKQMDDLFGEPPLIAGESKERYLKLRTAVAQSIEPKTIYDWMMVNDQTNKYWEELRLRSSAAALIEGAYVDALESLLRPFCTAPDVPSEIVRGYYSGSSKIKQQKTSQVAGYGITPEQIQAKAIQIIGSALQMIDRMIANRETSRRKLRKENERRFEISDIVPAYSAKLAEETAAGLS